MPLSQSATASCSATSGSVPPRLAADPRYRILRELGRGGMGVVYEAIHRESGEHVAIKTLASRRAGLLRFKNEYRLASRLAHPNLVSLYDLVIDDELAYFAMELAPGVDLRRHVRTPAGGCHLPRLYAVCAQILDALGCLSAAGIVHRDLKPSNILVSDRGQIKILDFGLAGAADTLDFSDAMAAGTPTYMSPEQIDRRPMDVRSDLYSLGVIVYEMLCGEPPFCGEQRQVLEAQRFQHPRPPSERVDAIPPALELWVLKLLAKQPTERFQTAQAARQTLELCNTWLPTARDRAQVWSRRPHTRDQKLIGRSAELQQLRLLLERCRRGESHLVLLTGEPGIGKTALAEAWLDEARAAGCVALKGLCRDDEVVRYNAFDQIVDGAAALIDRALRNKTLPKSALEQLLGEDLPLLTHLFPVLRELIPHRVTPTAAPQEHAQAAIGRLVAQIAATRPLVLLLDDLHWADEDSLALLEHLLSIPRLMVVATAGSPSSSGQDRLGRLLRRIQGSSVTHLWLGPLSQTESAQLVLRALPTPSLPAATMEQMVIEAAGNPFLLAKLAQLYSEQPSPTPSLALAVQRLLLSPEELAWAELVAVAAGPVEGQLLRAAFLDDSRPLCLEGASLRRLCGLKILREAPPPHQERPPRRGDSGCYDFYHQRIRRAVVAKISGERTRRLQRRLADTRARLQPATSVVDTGRHTAGSHLQPATSAVDTGRHATGAPPTAPGSRVVVPAQPGALRRRA